MRPSLLNPLFAPVTSLPGVGPKQDKLLHYLLSRNETPRLVDLLLHLPSQVIDRRARPKIRDAVQGTMVTLEVTVDRHRPPPPRNARAPYLVYASDDTGDVVLTFFRAKPGYVEKLLPMGEKRYVSGTLQMYDGIPQIVHPDRVLDEEAICKTLRYRSGLSADRRPGARLAPPRGRAGAAKAAGPAGMDQPGGDAPLQFPPIAEALSRVHQPVELTDILPDSPFWSRLAFDELLAGQLALALIRAQLRRPAGVRNAGDGHLRNKIIDALPYALTSSQRDAAAAIAERSATARAHAAPASGRCRLRQDRGRAAGGRRCRRSRQAGRADGADGDSGAPAHQDHRPARRARRLRVAILTGREKGKERREIFAQLAEPARSISSSAPMR